MPKAAPKSSKRAVSRSNPLSTKGNPSGKKTVPKSAKKTDGPRAIESPVSETTNGIQYMSDDKDGEFNYLLHVAMSHTHDPVISRILSVPSSLNFARLHEVLQIAFGWLDLHMHAFTVLVESATRSESCPPRNVALILQEHADDENVNKGDRLRAQDETEWTLRDVFEKRDWDGQVLLTVDYEYDMGDGWEHQISMLGRADDDLGRTMGSKNGIFCISGEGHPCVEDCGGSCGWQRLKDAFTKRGGDKDLKDWYKMVCTDGDPKRLDPYQWDISDVNKRLRNLEYLYHQLPEDEL